MNAITVPAVGSPGSLARALQERPGLTMTMYRIVAEVAAQEGSNPDTVERARAVLRDLGGPEFGQVDYPYVVWATGCEPLPAGLPAVEVVVFGSGFEVRCGGRAWRPADGTWAPPGVCGHLFTSKDDALAERLRVLVNRNFPVGVRS